MAAGTKGIPEGVSAVIPRLFCRDPEAEIGFCTRTFNAVELNRRPGADGKTAHALITIGPAMVMIESEWPPIANRAPETPLAVLPLASTEKTSSLVPVGNKRSPRCSGAYPS